MERTIFAKFESSVTGANDKKAIVYQEGTVYYVSFYIDDMFVYALPSHYESPILAAQQALSFVAGMNFDVQLSGD